MSDINYKKFISVTLILSLGILIVFSLKSFIDAFLAALMIYVMFRPLMTFLLKRWKWNAGWSAVAIILLTIALVVVPIIFISQTFIPKVVSLFTDSTELMDVVHRLDADLEELAGISLINPENIETLKREITNSIASIVGETLSILADLGIMILLLYYMLVNVGKLEKLAMELLPIRTDNLQQFGNELVSQTYSNVLGAPILALVQGLVATLGYYLFKIDEPFFWGILTGIFSFIPLVGSALIWFPAALYQFSLGDYTTGIGVLLFGVFIISMIDNVFRFIFQKKFADVHPLITVLGVILGINLFGITGIIFGPLLISYFVIMLRIYRKEFIMMRNRSHANSTEAEV
jgi:predicted PurR-regulated permease PerM